MEKITIHNRKGQRMVALLEKAETPLGLAIIMHGLGGHKDEPHIVTFAQSFAEKSFTTLRFDTTNTFGESDGNYEDATITNYYEDLEDVIAFAKNKPWYKASFYLVGHSLGGISTILYAEKHPQEVRGLAPVSSVISGALRAQLHGKEYLAKWETTGWKSEASLTVPGRIKRLKWNHMVDSYNHDVLPNAGKLTMPVLLLVGDQDDVTPAAQQQLLYDKLPGVKEFHVIKNAPHTFKDPAHLAEIKTIFKAWIEKVENGRQ
jgi:pimeloyl-ACP methyl ester carboxylesterase